MSPKKSVHDIRNDFLSYVALRAKKQQEANELSHKERRLLDELRQSCNHDVRCLQFMGKKKQVRFCFMCGTREEAVNGAFTLVKGKPLRYVRDGQLSDPGTTVGPATVQKMLAHLVSKTRPRVQKLRENSRS